jgi:hypothetical protein
MKGRVISRLRSHFVPKTIDLLDVALLDMATTIHTRGVALAPRDKGNLVSSGRVKRNGKADYTVSFGGDANGFSVPYAKRRHYENRKNPQTLRYLERAGDGVKKEGIRKFIGAGR